MIVTVRDWIKTSPAIAVRPYIDSIVSNALDLDNLLVKRSKLNAAFLIIIKLAKKGKILILDYSQWKWG